MYGLAVNAGAAEAIVLLCNIFCAAVLWGGVVFTVPFPVGILMLAVLVCLSLEALMP